MIKKIILSMFFGCAALAMSAQDVIILKNSEEIKAKVESVSKDNVSFRKWDNLNGPLYTMEASSIKLIRYQNGQQDVFGTTEATGQKKTGGNPYPAGKTRFQSYLTVGGLFGGKMGPSADLSLGIRIRNYTYIGVQAGAEIYFQERISGSGQYDYYKYNIPIGADIKCYIPTNGKWFPYTDLVLGVALVDGKTSRFYNYLGFGIDLWHLSLGIGWSHTSNFTDQFAVKVGLRFGK